MSHNIIDPDLHFIIDADSRSITNETGEVLTIMQYDHNSERATFELPRYIEDHDMSKCDLVLVLFANTSKGTSVSARSTSSGVYQVTDLEIKQDETKTLTCSWLISREATQYVGTLKFQIQFVCHENEETDVPEYYWHTDQCNMINIKPSLSSGNDVGEAYPDIITSMDARVSVLEDNGVPQDRLATAIDEYLAEHPIEKLTPEELRAAIDAYFVDNPVDQVTDEYIEGVIAQYLIDHPVEGEQMTTEEFNTAVEDYISTRPMDSKTEDKVNTMIGEYVQNNPIPGTVTDEALATAINAYFTENPITATGGGKLPNEYYADMFTTSKKIQLYENGDESDDIFIRAEGANLVWYRGICTGEVETLQNLFWIDEEHTALTAEETEYQVEVYIYDEHVRMGVEIVDDGTYGPKWTFGEGGGYDDPDWGKAFLEKTSELMKFYLLNDAGKEIGIDIGNNYVDIKGLRKPTNIDFTDTGFTVTMYGGGSMAYTYTKDTDGNITAITDSVGHVTNISFTGVS